MKSKKRSALNTVPSEQQREDLKKQLKEELREELIGDLKKENDDKEQSEESEETEKAGETDATEAQPEKSEEESADTKIKINLPNKLTIFRILLVPIVMIFIYIESDVWSKIIASIFFLTAAVTDLADGIIARKHNIITDFGKFMDPLADKFLVVGSLIAITASNNFETIRFLSVWVTAGVFFRELAVTSVRLIANTSDGNVIAAGFLGKIKTTAQICCILIVLLEDIIITANFHTPDNMFSYIAMSLMLALTVYSGLDYLRTYWKYIDPAK